MKRQPLFDTAHLDPVDGIYNTDPDAPYVNGDPRIGRSGSIPPFEAVDHPQKELAHLISNAGLTPTHTDLEQVRKAVEAIIKRSILSIGGASDLVQGYDDATKQFWVRSLEAGSNITITAVESPASSGKYKLRIAAAGGGGGGGGDPLQNVGDGIEVYKGLSGGYNNIRTIQGVDGIATSLDGGSNKVLVSGAALLGRGFIDGLITARTGNRTLSIGVGAGVSSDVTALIQLGSPATVDLSSTGANGLDTGTIANATFYHVYVIKNTTSGAVAGLASTSLTPTMPSGYTVKRRIGSILTNGSANIVDYVQIGDEFIFKQPIADLTMASYAGLTPEALVTLSVPRGVPVRARVIGDGYAGTPDAFFAFATPGQNLVAWNPPSQTLDTGKWFFAYGRSTALSTSLIDVMTDTSARILAWVWNVSGWVLTNGWIDPRGRTW